MPYFPNQHILFIHIPKTGGTSIEHSLVIDDLKLMYSPFPYNSTIPEKIYQKTSLQHQFYSTIKKYHEACNINFDNKLRVFSIVRNPYEKIVSDLFFYKLIDNKTDSERVYHVIKKYIKLLPSQCDNHNVPQYVFLIDETGNIPKNIKVFKTETLNKDARDYGITLSRHKHLKSNCSQPYFNFLNDKCVKIINSVYNHDFRSFGYKKFLSKQQITKAFNVDGNNIFMSGYKTQEEKEKEKLEEQQEIAAKKAAAEKAAAEKASAEKAAAEKAAADKAAAEKAAAAQKIKLKEEVFVKEKLKKHGIVVGQKCATPGCIYTANTSYAYISQKSENLYGYCCQSCKCTTTKSHGSFCKKEIYKK